MVEPTPQGYTAYCRGELIEGDVEDLVAFVAGCLERTTDPPYIGCSRDVLVKPINISLAHRGCTLRAVQNLGAGHHCEVSVSFGTRSCRFDAEGGEMAPYTVWFDEDGARYPSGSFKTIADVAAAVELWLEEDCDFEDVAAIAEHVFGFSWPPRARHH